MAWRLARSLDVLRDEILAVAPGSTVWTIGDEDHQDEWSDHNPNECCHVVCAADILSNAGLDLAHLVATITATDPPALKYVIYRERIWFPQTGWQPYRGAFHSHVHVSVGWGPDGRSTGPYDDTSPWGLLEEDDMSFAETWFTDGIPKPPGYEDSDNENWAPSNIIRSTQMYARRGYLVAKANEVKLDLALATTSGLTVEQIQQATAAGMREVLGSLDEEA